MDKLNKILKAIFPSTFNRGSKIYDINIKSITKLQWINLGVIRPNNKYFKSRMIKNQALPEEIESISIKLVKLYPSFFVLRYFIHIKDESKDILHRIHRKKWISEMYLTKLYKIFTKYPPHGENRPGHVREKNIFKKLEEIQSQVETFLKPISNGHFSNSNKNKTTKLPVIDMYSFNSNIDLIKKENAEKVDEYLNAYGLWIDHPSTFSNKDTIFMYPSSFSNRPNKRYSIIINLKKYLEHNDTEIYGTEEKEAVINHSVYLRDSLLPGIVTLEYLHSIKTEVEKSRLNIIGELNSQIPMRKFYKTLKSSSFAQHLDFQLSRINLEYKQYYKIYKSDSGYIMELKRNCSYYNDNTELYTVIKNQIEDEISFLRTHMDLIKTAINDFTTNKNMAIIYKLQKRMVWLSIIVIIATIISIIINFENLQDLWNSIMNNIE